MSLDKKDKKVSVEQITESIQSLRPFLQDDGGDIEIIEVTDEDVVKIRWKGSCITCPANVMTLKSGIETTIKQAFPQIKSVIAI
jgi:Fe-S cluster biogenesis protein NfuA